MCLYHFANERKTGAHTKSCTQTHSCQANWQKSGSQSKIERRKNRAQANESERHGHNLWKAFSIVFHRGTTKWNLQFMIFKTHFERCGKSRRNAMEWTQTEQKRNSKSARKEKTHWWTWTNDLTGEIVSHKPKRKYFIVVKMAPFRAYSSPFSSGFIRGTPSSHSSCFSPTIQRTDASLQPIHSQSYIQRVQWQYDTIMCHRFTMQTVAQHSKLWEIGPNGSYIFHWLSWTTQLSQSAVHDSTECHAQWRTQKTFHRTTRGCWKIKQFLLVSKMVTHFTGSECICNEN